MRQLLTVCVLACGLSLMSHCAAVQRVWPAFIECAMTSEHDLVADIQRILERDGEASELSAESKAQIEALAAHWGVDVVACVLEQLIDQWLAPGRTAIPRSESQAARRAQLFLSQHDSHPSMLE